MGWKVYGMGRSFEGEDMDRELEKAYKEGYRDAMEEMMAVMVNVECVEEWTMMGAFGTMMMNTEKDVESKVLVPMLDVDANSIDLSP